MNRREFFLSPFIIKHIVINDEEWITLFIPREYVNNKYYLERYLRKFCLHLNISTSLIMDMLKYVELTKDNQKYLALKGRNNGKILEILIGTADHQSTQYSIGWNIKNEQTY